MPVGLQRGLLQDKPGQLRPVQFRHLQLAREGRGQRGGQSMPGLHSVRFWFLLVQQLHRIQKHNLLRLYYILQLWLLFEAPVHQHDQ
jgi:hypothetical protein